MRRPNRSEGVVAAGNRATASAAAEILADGGNAVDAVLAGLCVACVAEPVLASLGGGGFLAVHAPRSQPFGVARVYDFFVQTPKRRRPAVEADLRAVAADFGPAQQTFHVGLGAIAAPGVVRGMFAAHRDLGRLPLRRVVAPAVHLAKAGVALDATQAYAVRVVAAILMSHPSARALFGSPSRPAELIAEGELMRVSEFGDFLEVLAVEGEDLFYRGEVARLIADACAAGGGHLTVDDLRDYRVERRQPLVVERFDASFALNPPPAEGGLLIAFGLDLTPTEDLSPADPASEQYLVRLARVLRATGDVRVKARMEGLLDATAADRLLDPALLGDYRNMVLGQPAARRGTTHLSVIDGEGMAASLTVSNGEGSGFVIPGTGVLLNNMLGEEDLLPDGLDCWPENQRMSSMMSPTLVFGCDGSIAALGSGGSKRIRSAILQVLLNLYRFRMSLAEAIAAPRLHVDEEMVSCEPMIDQRVVNAFRREFTHVHEWPTPNLFFGGVHAALRTAAGRVDGAGDSRRGGVALVAASSGIHEIAPSSR